MNGPRQRERCATGAGRRPDWRGARAGSLRKRLIHLPPRTQPVGRLGVQSHRVPGAEPLRTLRSARSADRVLPWVCALLL